MKFCKNYYIKKSQQHVFVLTRLYCNIKTMSQLKTVNEKNIVKGNNMNLFRIFIKMFILYPVISESIKKSFI